MEVPAFTPGRKSIVSGRGDHASGLTRDRQPCKMISIRGAYKCRAYPDPEQAATLARTFGCIRVVWVRREAALPKWGCPAEWKEGAVF